jgi:hypothetical protein
VVLLHTTSVHILAAHLDHSGAAQCCNSFGLPEAIYDVARTAAYPAQAGVIEFVAAEQKQMRHVVKHGNPVVSTTMVFAPNRTGKACCCGNCGHCKAVRHG